jgi:hypothetical protein
MVPPHDGCGMVMMRRCATFLPYLVAALSDLVPQKRRCATFLPYTT